MKTAWPAPTAPATTSRRERLVRLDVSLVAEEDARCSGRGAARSSATVAPSLKSPLEADDRRHRGLDAVVVQRKEHRAGQQPRAADADFGADRAEQLVHRARRHLQEDFPVGSAAPLSKRFIDAGVAHDAPDHVAGDRDPGRHRHVRAERVVELLAMAAARSARGRRTNRSSCSARRTPSPCRRRCTRRSRAG